MLFYILHKITVTEDTYFSKIYYHTILGYIKWC